MTRDNLIFLGACSIMSSHLTNFQINPEENLKNSIDWATKIYDQVHAKSELKTAAPEPARTYIVEFHDSDGEWGRSWRTALRGEFNTREQAQNAIDRNPSDGDFIYRVTELPAPEQWEVQCYFTGEARWARSGNKFLDQTFASREEAVSAKTQWGSQGMGYRVVQL